jgi:hypothetical protein
MKLCRDEVHDYYIKHKLAVDPRRKAPKAPNPPKSDKTDNEADLAEETMEKIAKEGLNEVWPESKNHLRMVVDNLTLANIVAGRDVLKELRLAQPLRQTMDRLADIYSKLGRTPADPLGDPVSWRPGELNKMSD